jgi:hypothetical protein
LALSKCHNITVGGIDIRGATLRNKSLQLIAAQKVLQNSRAFIVLFTCQVWYCLHGKKYDKSTIKVFQNFNIGLAVLGFYQLTNWLHPNMISDIWKRLFQYAFGAIQILQLKTSILFNIRVYKFILQILHSSKSIPQNQ